MPKKKRATEANTVKLSNVVKETQIRRTMSFIVEHIKSQVRSTILEASNKKLIGDIDERNLNAICNIVDTTIGSAYATASKSEITGLCSVINKQARSTMKNHLSNTDL